MASPSHCGCAAPMQPLRHFKLISSKVLSRTQIPTKLCPSQNILPTTLNFNWRNKDVLRLQTGQRQFAVYASNTNPSGGDSTEEKSAGTKTSDAAQGPPFLTILAGFLVLFLIVWIVGSIISWLISLIFNFRPK
ncbi:hypothetical protein FEM48_Zijuj01G0025100 [Ziziphus jujuba var. spinosa]|uniref:Uncharacterized protein n=1 Tax=Ziziphus jujuba var. spinosa TaxID=714518 RepID=A0A978VYM0_ZIZJJ|nr:hypothetical protein FEM48_Zijuj01G0025100 [Ziziphus jujuba var. spinosa]